jgi:hypothetical protein
MHDCPVKAIVQDRDGSADVIELHVTNPGDGVTGIGVGTVAS